MGGKKQTQHPKLTTKHNTTQNMKKETTSLFKIDWSKPYQAIVKITPEDAMKILEHHNLGNRFLRQGGAKYIAQQITNGEWVENHPQPICFSTNGTLIDGQHRVNGILLSAKTVWASCHFGVNPDYVKYLDTGISRALCDRVHFVDNKVHNKFIASLITWRYNQENRCKVTPENAMQDFIKHQSAYEQIAPIRQPKVGVGKAVVGLVFADYYEKYGKEALHMYAELFTLTTDCQPAQALKAFLLTTSIDDNSLYPYLVSACLANHDRRQVKAVRAATWR